MITGRLFMLRLLASVARNRRSPGKMPPSDTLDPAPPPPSRTGLWRHHGEALDPISFRRRRSNNFLPRPYLGSEHLLAIVLGPDEFILIAA